MGIKIKKTFKNWWIRGICIYLIALLLASSFALINFQVKIIKNNAIVSISFGSPIFASTTTNNPSTSAGGWTNPTNAYADNAASATITSGSPSANATYGGYGFSLSGQIIDTVRVRADAWTNGVTGFTSSLQPTANTNGSVAWTNPANAYDGGSNAYAVGNTYTTTANTYPTSTIEITNNWTCSTGATFWALVDDTSNTDYITGVTNTGGHAVFGFTAFSIPANSQNITLKITYSQNGGGTAALAAASLKVGGTYYDGLGSSATTSGFTERTYTTLTNPKTSANWTAAEINGTDGTNPLQGFGLSSTDFNPDVQFGYVYANVSYTFNDQQYTTFGFTDPGTSTTVTKVEIGYEAFSTTAQKLNLYTSANGGSTWSSVHTTSNLATSDPGAYTYVDVTADQTWTWTLLNNTNFKIKIETNYLGGAVSIKWNVDNLIVRVTYSKTANEQIKIQVTWDGGTTWSSQTTNATTGSEVTYWNDFTSATSWDGTKLNDTNFKVAIVAQTVGDTGVVNLDWIPVEVTYHSPTPEITVSPTTYNFGVIRENTTSNTSSTYFTIDNTSSIQTDQTISVTTNTWAGGVGWSHSDTATPGVDTVGLKSNKGGTWGTGDVIIKFSSPNFIAENQPANTDYSFGISLITGTFTDGVQKQIIIRITAVSG